MKNLICRAMLVFACFGLLFVFCAPKAPVSKAEEEIAYDTVERLTLPSDGMYIGSYTAFCVFDVFRTFEEAKDFCADLGGELCLSSELNKEYPLARLKTGRAYLVRDYYRKATVTSDSIYNNMYGKGWVAGVDWAAGHPILNKKGESGENKYAYVKIDASLALKRYSCSQESFSEEWAEDKVSFICNWKKCNCSRFSLVKGSVSPTCEKNGKVVFYCEYCNNVVSSKTLTNTHDFCDWYIVSGSTVIPPIVRERYCRLCNYTETVTDWGKIWVIVLIAIGSVGVVIGLISYIKMMVKQGKSK